MSAPDANSCPEPAVLAAFVEAKLSAADRLVVERHVTTCPECLLVVGEASDYLLDEKDGGEVEADPPSPSRRGWGFAAAAAAVLFVCLAVAWLATHSSDSLARLRALAARLPARPVEGRLDGFSYVPYVAHMGGPDKAESIGEAALQTEARRIREAGGNDGAAWHARGVAALVVGQNADAVRFLGLATQRSPEKAAYWNDLAAALLASSPPDSRAALAAADRAVALAPSLSAAHFNRALAADRLGRRAEAARSYARALDLDPRSPWAAETRRHLNRLSR